MSEEIKLTPTTTQLPPQLTEEETKYYEDKCLELAEKYKVSKVYCCVMIKADETRERIYAYFHEPNFLTKLSLIDVANRDGTRIAANQLRELTLLRDESHPIMVIENSANDRYQLGAAEFCIGIIDISRNELKKN